MFFIILGNLEPRPLAPQRRAAPCPVRDAGSPGNTCGSAALHALPRAAARRTTPSRIFEGRLLAGALAADRWTAVYDQVDASRHLPASPGFAAQVTRPSQRGAVP